MKDDEERERQEGLMDSSDGVVAAEEERNGMNRSQHGLHRPSSADSWPLLVGKGPPWGQFFIRAKMLLKSHYQWYL